MARWQRAHRQPRFKVGGLVCCAHTLFLLMALSAHMCWADPSLPNLIGDHMVLQQQRPIHIWGKADPKERVTVTLAGKTGSTQANERGQWSVKLPAMKSGGPFELNVRGKKEVIVKDVMIGEVWIAAGQSNMTFALSDSVGASEEVPKADYSEMRLFTVPQKVALQPQDDTLPAKWRICTPDAAKDFSAVAYYFARDLHRKLRVPIGIVESAWPGTAIEEWMEPASLTGILGPGAKKTYASVEREAFNLQFDDFELVRDRGGSSEFSNFDDGTSRDSLGGYWRYSWDSAPATAFTLISPGRGGNGYAAQIAGGQDASDDSRLVANFHFDNSPADLTGYTGIRFWVRGGGSFRLLTLQPTITDWDDYRSSVMMATADWKQIEIPFRDLHQEGWGVVQEFTAAALTGFALETMPAAGFPSRPPGGLYEGMITPLLPYPFRGAIWYQGESNALSAHFYRRELPALIRGWRNETHDEFPFLIVQLPNHGAVPEQPDESAWAELREAQLLALQQVRGTGLAVTIDVGDPKNVHPHRKAEVGERLALWAMGTTYLQPIVYSGPIYQSMRVQGEQIAIRFAHVGGGLSAGTDGKIQGFAIAGPDQKFHWAEAIIEGDAVLVSSPEVSQPVAVRYAWGDSPICNLRNKEGLPASPFRTDEWPGITDKTITAHKD